MFLHQVLIFTVIYFNFFLTNCSDDGVEKGRYKRNDIDLQTCIDHFDIHKDKIIRTQDSQNMGAKYLNEMDLGSREECLRLCCETENCDVFIFEEKNSGSCYLFHCGPPEDFKCQFTHHVNYSSAVLAINRHLPDLENEIKLTKHEQDLTKLRKPETDPEEAPEIQTTPSSTSTTTIKAIKAIVSSDVNNKAKLPEEVRKCSRYQFECRSTRECIAIYNACDGIPQCADGSDEAPELGCPDTFTTALPAVVHSNNPAPPPIRYDATIPQSRLNQQLQPNLAQPQQQDLYHPQLSQDNLNPQLQQQVQSHQEPDFIRPVADPRNNLNAPPRIQQYESQAYQAQIPIQQQQQQNGWVPHQSNQMPAQIAQYSDKNSHIFNHKENGLQVPDGQEISQIQYPEAINGREYPKMQSYYGENYRQPIQQDNWAINPSSSDDSQFAANRYASNSKDWHQDQDQTSVVGQPANYNKATPSIADHSTNNNNNWKTDKVVNPKHEQDKMAHELKHSKDQGTTIKIEKHKATHQDHYPDVVAVKMPETIDLQDGVAETPGGAVLSLTLGLIITFIMAILIGCRLRVRRRMRKSGKSYAHDADYLVNGMYL